MAGVEGGALLANDGKPHAGNIHAALHSMFADPELSKKLIEGRYLTGVCQYVAATQAFLERSASGEKADRQTHCVDFAGAKDSVLNATLDYIAVEAGAETLCGQLSPRQQKDVYVRLTVDVTALQERFAVDLQLATLCHPHNNDGYFLHNLANAAAPAVHRFYLRLFGDIADRFRSKALRAGVAANMTLEHVVHMILSALRGIGTSSSVVHTLQLLDMSSDDLVDVTPARTKEVYSMGYLGPVVLPAAARPFSPALPSVVAPAPYSPTTLEGKIKLIGVLAKMSGARAPHTDASASELVARMDSAIAAFKGALPGLHPQATHTRTHTGAHSVKHSVRTQAPTHPHTHARPRTLAVHPAE